MYNHSNKNRGFTLIELLVVISIIGLLSTIGVVALNQARKEARDVKRVADIKQIQTGLNLYYSSKNYYPPWGSAIIMGEGSKTALCNTDAGFENAISDCGASSIYVSRIAGDPMPDKTYTYIALIENGSDACASPPCQNYGLEFVLEGEVAGFSGTNCATVQGIQSGACPD